MKGRKRSQMNIPRGSACAARCPRGRLPLNVQQPPDDTSGNQTTRHRDSLAWDHDYVCCCQGQIRGISGQRIRRLGEMVRHPPFDRCWSREGFFKTPGWERECWRAERHTKTKAADWRTQRHHGQMPRCADWLQWPWPQTAEQRFTHTTQTCRVHSVVHSCCWGKQAVQQWWPKVVFVAERRCAGLSTGPSRQHRAQRTHLHGTTKRPADCWGWRLSSQALWSDWQLLCTGKCAKSLVQQGETLCWKLDLSNTLLINVSSTTTTMTVSWMRSSSSTLTTWCGPILRPSHPHLGEPLWMGQRHQSWWTTSRRIQA